MPTLSDLPDLSRLLRLAMGRDPQQEGDPATWAIIDLHGAYPTRHGLAAVQSVVERTESIESLGERLDKLAELDTVKAVLVRVVGLTAGLATSEAIGRVLGRLQQRKRVVVYLPQVNMRSLLVSAEVREVVAPESAEVMLAGFAAEQVYYGEFLTRRGIGFENLRIKEYKSALTRFSEDRMDDFDREQLTAYIDSAERSWRRAVHRAEAGPEETDQWPEAGFTNADQLLESGLVTRIAYDDEIAVPVDQGWEAALQVVRTQLAGKRRAKKEPGIAVVPVVGAIVSGRSRPASPLSGQTAGSETVVAALRKAERDEHTKAILLHVDSGGGSALASDVICRAVARCTKPVVAVMGEVAASGGYYVLAQADHVVASPFTITGSIGVVVGKPVLSDLNERIGRNPETVGREMALFGSPNRPFSADERVWAERMMDEVYARFVSRVADGRKLDPDRVNEIGRGRIWSGTDAQQRGLVDELGDLQTGIAAARRLAELPEDAPVRSISAGFALPGVPTFGKDPAAALATAALQSVWPFGEELVLTWFDSGVTIR